MAAAEKKKERIKYSRAVAIFWYLQGREMAGYPITRAEKTRYSLPHPNDPIFTCTFDRFLRHNNLESVPKAKDGEARMWVFRNSPIGVLAQRLKKNLSTSHSGGVNLSGATIFDFQHSPDDDDPKVAKYGGGSYSRRPLNKYQGVEMLDCMGVEFSQVAAEIDGTKRDGILLSWGDNTHIFMEE